MTTQSDGFAPPLPKEQPAATAMLDKRHADLGKPRNDSNAYRYALGSIGGHNVVIACLPLGRLGGAVVGTPVGEFPGVVQWDMGKETSDGFERIGALNNPPTALLTALSKLKTKREMFPKLARKYLRSDSLGDVLFRANYDHVRKPGPDDASNQTCDEEEEEEEEEEDENCRYCDRTKIAIRMPKDMQVHYGLIASGNTVIKTASTRRRLNEDLVIRGISNCADSHTNNGWEEHAAAAAAAFAKELPIDMKPKNVAEEPRAKDVLGEVKLLGQGIEGVRNLAMFFAGHHPQFALLTLQLPSASRSNRYPRADAFIIGPRGSGHERALTPRLEGSADPEAASHEAKQSPLSWTAGNAREGVARLLLDNSADPDTRDSKGQTPLLWASRQS
ncbi:hypothetical protein MKZ38_010264 [Zalerion maritima]|uniref:Uncharacterized protein n=1 Tax=Zalerion maritima TaxID=339359 RepID=A0AAD5WUM0_9PEZI|nr:hypothetical protein MKZ38_010264 [Zalerion maritima]